MNVGKDVERVGSSCTSGGDVKWCRHFRKQSGNYLMVKSCDPAIPLLGMYLREMKTYIHIKTCTWVFAEALSEQSTSRNNPNVRQMMNE